jgi:hypothetical protein
MAGRFRFIAVLTGLAITVAGLGASTSSASSDKLADQARWVAMHGGVRGQCAGCATSQMQWLVRRLVVRRFSRAGSDAVRWSLCVVGRESGFNPGAVNQSSGAAGLFQFLGHPQFSTWKLLHDPSYAVDAAWSLSHGARDRSPWFGGGYSC